MMDITPKYNGGDSDEARPFCISWKNLNVSVKENPTLKERLFQRNPKAKIKNILTNVNGEAYSKSMLAIMGSSGSGKTTLLNVLFSSKTHNMKIKGQILVNSEPINIKRISAYVEQTDLFIPVLTVKEHLMFCGKLLLENTLTQKELKIHIDELMMQFGLEKCQDNQIGSPETRKGISGGECRRLSIASQVISNPRILFLDEPTSGLDSFTAETVVNILKKLAMRNCAIISTIHQPSSNLFKSFDRIFLLADGKVVYSGSNKESLIFFERSGFPCPVNYNPADYYIEVIAIKPGKEEESYKNINKLIEMNHIIEKEKSLISDDTNQEIYEISEDKIEKRSKATAFKQINALMTRSWKSITRDKFLFRARIFQITFISLFFGLIYLRLENTEKNIMNFQGAIFSILTNISFGGAIGVVFVLPSELSLYRREHSKRLYDTWTYFLTKSIADIPIFILIPSIMVFISYFMIGFNPTAEAFISFWLISVLVNQCSVSYGYLVASISKDIGMATAIVGPMLIPLLIFGGFYIKVDSIPSYFAWISYISWFRYSFDALVAVQFRGINIKCLNESLYCSKDTSHVSKDSIIKLMGLNDNGLLVNSLAIFGLTIGYKILALLIIIIKTKCSERNIKLK